MTRNIIIYVHEPTLLPSKSNFFGRLDLKVSDLNSRIQIYYLVIGADPDPFENVTERNICYSVIKNGCILTTARHIGGSFSVFHEELFHYLNSLCRDLLEATL
jgi:hypothetical protein